MHDTRQVQASAPSLALTNDRQVLRFRDLGGRDPATLKSIERQAGVNLT